VSKSGLNCFLAFEPSLVLYPSLDLITVPAGAGDIDVNDRLFEIVEHIGLGAHLLSIADNPAPWRMNHHARMLADRDMIASHRNDGGDGCCPAINLHIDLGVMLLGI